MQGFWVRFLLRLSAIVVLVSTMPTLGQTTAPAPVTGVLVQFADGSQQQFVPPATPPTTSPDCSVPSEVPPGENPARPATAPSTAPAHTARRSLMGVNLEQLKDYSRSKVFIDTIRTARRFGSPEKPWSGADSLKLDANGWPLSDFGVVVFTEAVDVNGVYRLSCVGPCSVKAVSGSPAKVRNLQYDERTNRTLGEIVYQADPKKPSSLFLSITGTRDGVKNLKLLRPGYDGDLQVFTNEFLSAIQPFSTLRFMDWTETNSSPWKEWADRAKPSDATYATKGGSYETAILLANRSKKDIWINVPALASDDFIVQLATLVKEKLDPDLKCTVEYSNEVWNRIFAQYKQNLEAAKSEVKAGEQTLNDNGAESNSYYWGFRRVGKRTVEISRLFRDVFGDQRGRYQIVLAGQLVNTKVLEESLEWIEKYAGGSVKDHIDAIAVAPYFGNNKTVMNSDGLTVDQIVDVLAQKVIAGINHHVTNHHALARKYGVRSMAYEAGVDLGQFNKSVDIKIAAQSDPRAGQAVETYLANWFGSGGDLLMYFNLCSTYGKSGYWGLTNRISDLTAPKYQAAVRVAARTGKP